MTSREDKIRKHKMANGQADLGIKNKGKSERTNIKKAAIGRETKITIGGVCDVADVEGA